MEESQPPLVLPSEAPLIQVENKFSNILESSKDPMIILMVGESLGGIPHATKK